MRKFRCTVTLALVAAGAAVLLSLIRQAEWFPTQVMLIFWPADYLWQYLRTEVAKGTARTVVSNVAVFCILAALEGAIVGFLLDSFLHHRKISLRRRVKYLSYSKNHVDLAFRRRVLDIVIKYDPAGLLAITADKEVYRPETELILSNLNRLGSAKGLQKFCRRNFKRHFGRHAVAVFDKYEVLSKDIWAEYEKSQSLPRQAPPITPGV
jgi:hypothetical protein